MQRRHINIEIGSSAHDFKGQRKNRSLNILRAFGEMASPNKPRLGAIHSSLHRRSASDCDDTTGTLAPLLKDHPRSNSTLSNRRTAQDRDRRDTEPGTATTTSGSAEASVGSVHPAFD